MGRITSNKGDQAWQAGRRRGGGECRPTSRDLERNGKKGARTHDRRGPRTARRPTDATFNFGVSIMSNQDQKDYIALSTKRGLQFVQVRLCFRFPFRKKNQKPKKSD
jgi:hypothetical protein